ncbi:hypothetical protein NEHOM01_0088 [Nematocida homosporus]|uniref:uncharacterized protein n=1 Tax=Nematocida homosporus TaxID=1912981 RepID=UPI00221E8E19|nr:uncharacterized protein NEHOM01_0088 [Nematocida homosporus]KAI5184343.1 hypothetical protein NEHOM01_0088 [Nematocida homosporus]
MPSCDYNPADELYKAQQEYAIARTAFDKGVAKAKIRQIEEALKSARMGPITTTKSQAIVTSIAQTQTKPTNTYSLTNTHNQAIKLTSSWGSATIDCVSYIQLDQLNVQTSCKLTNSSHSTFYITASQIRVTSCQHLTLYVYSKTGVSIEDSSDITVLPYQPDPQPSWPNNTQIFHFNQITFL